MDTSLLVLAQATLEDNLLTIQSVALQMLLCIWVGEVQNMPEPTEGEVWRGRRGLLWPCRLLQSPSAPTRGHCQHSYKWRHLPASGFCWLEEHTQPM